MRKSSLFVILLGCVFNSFAQTDAPSDTKKDPVVEQFIGVQMNSLIRQVFNFNNATTSTNVSPYLVNYNINSIKTGWGLRVGIGYNYSANSTNDGITATTTKLNDLQFRLGVEKAFKLSSKWSTGVGVDFIYNSNNDNTVSTVTSSDTVTTTNKTVSSSYGAGPMGWLRYHITEHVIIGTEASFYYTTGKQKNTIDVTSPTIDPNTGLPTTPSTTETTSSPTTSQGNFTIPVAFYLIVKF